MPRNPFGVLMPGQFNPITGEPYRKQRRTARTSDKNIAWEKQKGKCAICGKRLDPVDMEWGHRRAYSKGGSTARGALVHHKCNKLQGTMDMSVIRRKLGHAKKGKRRQKARRRQRTSNPFGFNARNPFGL